MRSRIGALKRYLIDPQASNSMLVAGFVMLGAKLAQRYGAAR
jgi:hypothetical protein